VKKPAILTQLEILCSNPKKASRCGHITQRDSRLTYDKEQDLELIDWVYGSLELGYILTRELIKEKALELIQGKHPSFRASDSWLGCFLNRHHLSLRKLNEKIAQQKEHLDPISEKFKRAIQNTIKKQK